MAGGVHPLDGADALCRLSAAELGSTFATGALSPVEAVAAALRRAEAVDPLFNAFTFLDGERALDAARAAEKRWRAGTPLSPVDGVPTTLKDIVWVEGWPVRYGSRTVEAGPRAVDAPSVARLRAAGAVFIGQTTTPEFGWKAVTDSALSGITRNPWDARLTPGGSSGGAAVAAATGAGALHLGTDGGGSIRVPAAFTGIFGLKPTFGRVPAHPPSAFGTVAHIGPMTRGAADARLMLAAMAGRDPRDWMQGPGVLPSLEAGPETLKGLRVGYWTTPPAGRLDGEVAAAVAAAARLLEGAGATIEPVELPGEDLLDLFHRHWFVGAATRRAAIPAGSGEALDPAFLEVAEMGARFSARDVVEAQMRRAEFGAAMDALLGRFDVLLSPAVTTLPFEAGLEVPRDSGLARWTEWASFSFPINLSQQPACVLPCGLGAGGLPVGLQLVGARGADGRLLALAEAVESLLPSTSQFRHPSPLAPAAGPA